MTSEAHKQNPPGSARWGARTKIVMITGYEALAIEAAGIGGPRLYYEGGENDEQQCIFADAAELERWRASRAVDQA